MVKDFECEKCGFCCQLDVKITQNDFINLIKNKKENFSIIKDNDIMLRKGVNGNCQYFEDGLCSIYNFRPEVCQNFPFEEEGMMSHKCRQKKDFQSQVAQKIIKFMNHE